MTTIAELAVDPPVLVFSSEDPQFTEIRIEHNKIDRDTIRCNVYGIEALSGQARPINNGNIPSRGVGEIQAYCKMLDYSQSYCINHCVYRWVIVEPNTNCVLLVEQTDQICGNVDASVYAAGEFVGLYKINLFAAAGDPYRGKITTADDLCRWMKMNAYAADPDAMIRWLRFIIVANHRMVNYSRRYPQSTDPDRPVYYGISMYHNIDLTYGRVIDTTLRVEFDLSDYLQAMISDFSLGEICGVIMMRPKNRKLPPVIYGKIGMPAVAHSDHIMQTREKMRMRDMTTASPVSANVNMRDNSDMHTSARNVTAVDEKLEQRQRLLVKLKEISDGGQAENITDPQPHVAGVAPIANGGTNDNARVLIGPLTPLSWLAGGMPRGQVMVATRDGWEWKYQDEL